MTLEYCHGNYFVTIYFIEIQVKYILCEEREIVMLEAVHSSGHSLGCQSPKNTLPPSGTKTTYDVIQDVVAMEKAAKLAERINELKNKPEDKLTNLERIELSYYNLLKAFAKFNGTNTVIY